MLKYSLRLNEGFATLFEYQISGEIYPDWNIRHFFNIRTLHSAFRSDGTDTTRAMTSPYLTPAQINNAFDFVVYAKCKWKPKVERLISKIVSCSWKRYSYVPERSRRHNLQSFAETLLGGEVRSCNKISKNLSETFLF